MSDPTQVASYSSLTTHRTCPQRWSYRYVDGLQKVELVRVELSYGSWWHAVMAADAIEQGRLTGTLAYCPESIRTTDGGPRIPTSTDQLLWAVFDAADEWWGTLPEAEREPFIEKLHATVPDNLRRMYAAYLDRWSADREHEEVIAVEPRFRRDLGTTGTTLIGAVDLVYRDTRRGMIVVRDAKGHKSLTRNVADDLMDSQLHLYAWGINPMVREWTGSSVRAVSYDRARTTSPKEPRLTKGGTLSKAVTDFDLATYLSWAAGPDGSGIPFEGTKKDGSNAGVYTAEESVIERLSTREVGDLWFNRTLAPLNINVVRAHLTAAGDTVEDMKRTLTREPARNFSSACQWCDYLSICRAQMIGGRGGEYEPADHGLYRKS